MGIRRQSRETAVQALFMCDFMNCWSPDDVTNCFEHFQIDNGVREYSELLALGVLDRREEVDAKITSASEHWSISRMGRVDRSILRLATFELVFCRDIPVNVAINEAIEVAKRFGSDDSPTFINGVLDRVAHSARGRIQRFPVEERKVVAQSAEEDEETELSQKAASA